MLERVRKVDEGQVELRMSEVGRGVDHHGPASMAEEIVLLSIAVQQGRAWILAAERRKLFDQTINVDGDIGRKVTGIDGSSQAGENAALCIELSPTDAAADWRIGLWKGPEESVERVQPVFLRSHLMHGGESPPDGHPIGSSPSSTEALRDRLQ